MPLKSYKSRTWVPDALRPPIGYHFSVFKFVVVSVAGSFCIVAWAWALNTALKFVGL